MVTKDPTARPAKLPTRQAKKTDKIKADLPRHELWAADHPEKRSIASLVPYARNARTHSDEQIDLVARLIQRFGWTSPILVRGEDCGIIAGHCRVLAAERLGIAEVPVVVAHGWSEDEVRAYVIADNKAAINAGWDEGLLALELSALRQLGFDMDLTGFSDAELLALDPKGDVYKTDPDDVPDARPSPVSQRGQIWICGPHRVGCADAAVIQEVEAIMGGGALADAVWTDPPYNVNYLGSAGKITNDNMGDDAFADLLFAGFLVMFTFLKPGSAIYVAHADTEGLAFRAAFQTAGFHLSGCIIWRKNALVLGRSDYQWQHEPLLYGWKPGATHRWYGGRKQTTVAELDGSVFTLHEDGSLVVRVGADTVIVSGKELVARPVEPTVLWYDRPKRSTEHPTIKPVALIERMLRNSTREGDVVLDPFGGAGSTLIAAERLGRHARVCEIEGRFVDVIVKRWQEHTGKAAVLDGDGRSFDAIAAEHFGGGCGGQQ